LIKTGLNVKEACAELKYHWSMYYHYKRQLGQGRAAKAAKSEAQTVLPVKRKKRKSPAPTLIQLPVMEANAKPVMAIVGRLEDIQGLMQRLYS
jgi:hypothetical protein